jgi:hypothetical protein
VVTYLSGREKRILKIIREYKTMSKKQIKKLVGASDELLDKMVKNTMIQNTGDIYFIGERADINTIMALEVLIYFKKDVTWHLKANFPFCITFYMNNKVFDVAVIRSGEEMLISTAINRIQADRVIVVVEDISSIKKINIDKPVRFCTIEPIVFYSG